mmetsp:Transcript_14331/g.23991  ORF Transcript_14331/g.23991 Transcript_14331/m.23991 type:complete len:80 (+) Transcript_14331:37-276(+)
MYMFYSVNLDPIIQIYADHPSMLTLEMRISPLSLDASTLKRSLKDSASSASNSNVLVSHCDRVKSCMAFQHFSPWVVLV